MKTKVSSEISALLKIASAVVREQKPFGVLNYTALPEVLVEAELFGHEKGARSGFRRR